MSSAAAGQTGLWRRLSPWALFWLALALRLAASFALPARLLGSWDSDSGLHLLNARMVAEHATYGFAPGVSNAFCPPGYIWFLTPFAWLFRSEAGLILSARAAQSLLGAVVVHWMARLGERLGGRRAGAAAGLVSAFYPPLVLYSATMMTDLVFTFAQCAAVMAFIALQDKKEEPILPAAAAAGALTAWALLVREAAVGLAPLAAAALCLALPRRLGPKAAAGLLLGWALALTPWTLRNWAEFHRFGFSTLRGPTHLYVSQHIPEDGVWPMDGDVISREASKRLDDTATPWGRLALEELVTNPFKKPGPTLRMWRVKFVELWLHPSGLKQLESRPAAWYAYLAVHLALLGLFALGAWSCVRLRLGPALFPLLALAYTTVFHVFLTFPLARYFVPMLPFVSLFAGLGLERLLQRRTASS